MDYDNLNDDIDHLAKFIEDRIAAFPKERPLFSDKQVMSAEDLEVGKRYTMYKAYGKFSFDVILLDLVYSAAFETWLMRVQDVRRGLILEQTLEDNSVIAYHTHNTWNNSNYMEIVD